MPEDPAERAQAQALAHSIAVDLHPVCNLQVAKYATQLSGGAEGMPGDWMVHFIRPGLQAFNALLSAYDPAPFCTGETPGLADICLMPQLYNARRWGADFSDMPRLVAIEETCAAHPAFAKAHPDAVNAAG